MRDFLNQELSTGDPVVVMSDQPFIGIVALLHVKHARIQQSSSDRFTVYPVGKLIKIQPEQLTWYTMTGQ
jgi:hypothetical protein